MRTRAAAAAGRLSEEDSSPVDVFRSQIWIIINSRVYRTRPAKKKRAKQRQTIKCDARAVKDFSAAAEANARRTRRVVP